MADSVASSLPSTLLRAAAQHIGNSLRKCLLCASRLYRRPTQAVPRMLIAGVRQNVSDGPRSHRRDDGMQYRRGGPYLAPDRTSHVRAHSCECNVIDLDRRKAEWSPVPCPVEVTLPVWLSTRVRPPGACSGAGHRLQCHVRSAWLQVFRRIQDRCRQSTCQFVDDSPAGRPFINFRHLPDGGL